LGQVNYFAVKNSVVENKGKSKMLSQATNYLVAVLPDRIEAESAYLGLKDANLPFEHLDILGKGYKSADEFGLINPDQEAQKQTDYLATWVIVFGFAAGFLFNVLTGIQLISWIGVIGNHILGGFFAAAAAALGAFFTGTLTGWTTSSGDAMAYRNRLNAGKYLIIVTGTDAFMRDAVKLLRQYKLENLQGYVTSAES
jgi:hypothetical protein